MHVSIPLLVASLIYLLLILTLFLTKKKYNTIENKIYFILLITAIVGVLLDISGIKAHISLPETSVIRWLIVKFYMSYLLIFIFLITLYIIYVAEDVRKTKIGKNKTIIILLIISILLIFNFLLPFNYYNDGNIVYIYGANSFYLYFLAAISIITWIIYIFIKRKLIKKKKILPIITFILFCIPIVLFQMSNPELLLVTSLSSFVVVFMYHTIENPDMKLIAQLNEARDQTEKANNAKSEFLSNMSHEIRTPLNAIVGFSQALLEEDINDNAKEEVKDIVSASSSLLEIVNGILDISKIESGKLEIVNTEYNLNNILNDLVALAKARMGEKPINFRTNFDPTIPSVLYGDHVRIKQIILNLLTNAVKYTKEGYIEFKVSTVRKDDIIRLIISVEDSGIGIEEDKIDKLFSKFERLDIEKNNTIEGTGLGLAITKRLIELMNGKIVVQSVYGKGSRFTVAIDQKIISDVPLKEEKITISDEIIDCSSKKVLIVDDNKLNLKVASRLLEKYKCNIETIDSGIEAIELIKNNKYDLILLDDMMPKLSGTETLQKLKEIDNFNIPIVALTANAIEGMKEKYLKAGFNDYLSKPIDKTELNRIINEFLK